MSLPPAASSTAIILAGDVPSRSGQLARTMSWLPPILPEETMTAYKRVQSESE